MVFIPVFGNAVLVTDRWQLEEGPSSSSARVPEEGETRRCWPSTLLVTSSKARGLCLCFLNSRTGFMNTLTSLGRLKGSAGTCSGTVLPVALAACSAVSGVLSLPALTRGAQERSQEHGRQLTHGSPVMRPSPIRPGATAAHPRQLQEAGPATPYCDFPLSRFYPMFRSSI